MAVWSQSQKSGVTEWRDCYEYYAYYSTTLLNNV